MNTITEIGKEIAKELKEKHSDCVVIITKEKIKIASTIRGIKIAEAIKNELEMVNSISDYFKFTNEGLVIRVE